MKKYLLAALIGLVGCSPKTETVDAPGLLLSEVLRLNKIAALAPAKSTTSQTPDLILGGFHYGVDCLLGEGKRIDSKALVSIFDGPEQHFEQYNPWGGGEEKVLVAVDNWGLPILSFESREGVPGVLKIRGVVPTGQGVGFYAHTAFYCELTADKIVQMLYAIYDQGSEFTPHVIAEPK